MLLDSTEESRIASTSDSRRTANPQSHDVEQNSTVLTINDLRQWSPETAFSTSSSSSFNVTETTDVSGVAIDDRTIAKNTAPPAAPASTSLNADEYTYKSYGDHTKRRQKRREVGAQLRNTSSSVESTMSSENEKWRWNARFSAFIDALFRRLGLFIVDHNRSILVVGLYSLLHVENVSDSRNYHYLDRVSTHHCSLYQNSIHTSTGWHQNRLYTKWCSISCWSHAFRPILSQLHIADQFIPIRFQTISRKL